MTEKATEDCGSVSSDSTQASNSKVCRSISNSHGNRWKWLKNKDTISSRRSSKQNKESKWGKQGSLTVVVVTTEEEEEKDEQASEQTEGTAGATWNNKIHP